MLLGKLCFSVLSISSAIAQEATPDKTEQNNILFNEIDIPQKVIEDSPVLQKWLQEVPNIREEIRYDPAFLTRLRLGFNWFPSTDDATGFNIGVEDIFIKRTGLTFSADYQIGINGDRNAAGADLHYFLLPLGNYVNFAPLIGYRYVQSNNFSTDGVHLGLRLMLSFSRTGGGDISFSQSFISPGANEEVGITSVSVGYAVSSHLRLASDFELQNSEEDNDNRFGINLEWLLY
ncbi:hypothetical protein [Pleurocapsa sp. PCC 7319]|uniref:hypothetical protein n=1 Tax=Pleurocapsa sp. PCC 7319 TaxID=118161 RepID=UPI00034495DE|nr:hypothetical protein [Pleurocapsa sp. PCC 7319]